MWRKGFQVLKMKEVKWLAQSKCKTQPNKKPRHETSWKSVEYKRPNLQIIGIEEKKIHVKSTENIVNRNTKEKVSNLKKEMPIKIQEAYGTPNRQKWKRNSNNA